MTIRRLFLLLMQTPLVALTIGCQGSFKPTIDVSEAAPTINPQAQIQSEAQIWMHDPLLQQYSKVLLRRPSPIDANGAMGENKAPGKPFRVGWQREGFKAIAYGVSAQNRSAVEQGIKAYDFAFRQQDPDGLFGKSSYPEIMSFLGSYARAMLLLRDSGQQEYVQRLGQFRSGVAWAINNPKLIQQERELIGMIPQITETNQLIWAGLNYTLLFQLTRETRFKDLAKQCLKVAVSRQTEMGVFPEKGGGDTHYQAVSLEKLMLFGLYSRQLPLTQPYLQRGFSWLNQKITADYTMDTKLNTRTGQQQELGPSRQFKEGRYGNPEAYIFWSYLGGSPRSRQRANGFIDRIFQEKFGCSLSQCAANLDPVSQSSRADSGGTNQ